jgi:hypothetical protein
MFITVTHALYRPAESHAVRARRWLWVIAALLTGCVRQETYEYTSASWMLDKHNELSISTYPSWHRRQAEGVPYLYKPLRSAEAVYFQVFVRDAATRSGPNPHVRSILIRSFSYQLAGGPEVRLISDFGSNFWMQGQPQHNPMRGDPVPCVPGQRLTVRVSLMLNGQAHAREGELTCATRVRRGLLLIDTLLR